MSSNTARTVVCRAGPPGAGELPLFPGEDGGGVAFTHLELLRLSPLHRRLNRALSERWGLGLAREFGVPEAGAWVYAQYAAAPLTHFFMDRLLRLDRLASGTSAPLAIGRPAMEERPDELDRFESLASGSAEFNQALAARLAGLWGWPLADAGPPPPSGARALPPGTNRNFFGVGILGRVRRKLHAESLGLLGRGVPALKGRVPSRLLGYLRAPFMEKGIYGGRRLRDLDDIPARQPRPRDPGLRRRLFAAAGEGVLGAVEAFLKDSGCTRAARDVAGAFARYLEDLCPSAILEEVPDQFKSYQAYLKPWAGRSLLVESAGSLYSTIHLIAAARSLGMEVIGCQHGGGYGHMADLMVVYELEYPFCDRFVTWGWRRFPEEVAARRPIAAVPLPSPWLSERAFQWRRLLARRGNRRTAGEFDILLMTNKVYPFPPAPSGADVSRRDHLPRFAGLLKELVAGAARRGIRILHKPYNAGTIRLMERTMAELEAVGGDHYRCVDRLDKGLGIDLIRRCRAVVWDQPQTGFSECLTGGIPTMAWWPRLYNEEQPWARELFLELERAGLVHREWETLLEEAARMKADPAAWRDDPARARAIERYCRGYALVDPDWPKAWKEFIATL